MRRSVLLSILIILFIFPSSAAADIAPPAQPPGSNVQPGSETTQVQMLAETVLIDVQAGAPSKSLGQAHVTASFTMHNRGDGSETMAVRFPVSASDGYFSYPTIKDLRVKVNDKTVPTRDVQGEDPYHSPNPVPWAEFDVSFPPGRDVPIQVAYTLEASGEYPFIWFKYILSTGAGWKDAIGKADLIVRLPYPASNQNIFFDPGNSYSGVTPGGVVSGNEVRWHYDDLEPTTDDNFEIILVMPSAWENVLTEQANVKQDPNDGEAWGRLGKLYKELTFSSRGKGFRLGSMDPGGQDLYNLSLQAYEKAVSLRPGDPLWHAGFADLLAYHAYFLNMEGVNTTGEALRALREIRQALEMAPNDPKVQEIATEISYDFPEGMKSNGASFDFPWLTATPLPPTPMVETIISTETPVQEVTFTPSPLAASPTPAGEPQDNKSRQTLPFCGGALIIPIGVLFLAQRLFYAARKTKL
jgi:tetratricopeptide (TPR) repeat protein